MHKYGKKISKATSKGKELITESDYRGIISVTLVVGLIILLLTENYTGASVLGPLSGTSIGWYFSERRRERNGE